MADALAELEADVTGLQEVEGPDVVQEFAEELSEREQDYPQVFVSHGLDPFTGQDMALLLKYPAVIKPVLHFRSSPSNAGTEQLVRLPAQM